MVSLVLRDQRVTEVTLEKGANRVKMELDFQAHRAHLDLQDKLFTRQATSMVLLEVLDLREARVCLVKLDSLAQWDPKGTEVTQASQALE